MVNVEAGFEATDTATAVAVTVAAVQNDRLMVLPSSQILIPRVEQQGLLRADEGTDEGM